MFFGIRRIIRKKRKKKKMEKKNAIIALLIVIIVVQGGGLVYLWQQSGSAVNDQRNTLTVGTTLAIGRVPHPQFVHGGDDPITNAVFEALFGYVGTSLELEPVLAADMGTVSEDGLEYTIPLRQGVKFHDGTDFNATAVKEHFDLLFVINQGMAYVVTDGLLNKTEVVDTYTVKFTLNYANSEFRDVLAFLSCMIASPTATAKYGNDQLNAHPIGTGPFKFVSKIIDNEVVMEANEDWWQLQEGKEITIDELVFVYLSDPSTMKLAIEQGDIDATDGRFHVVDYPSLLANEDLNTHDVSGSSSRRWFTFNMNSTVWDHFTHKKVRQAFAHALPYDQILSIALDGNGERQYSFLPPEYVGYKEVFDYDYNITRALELISEAGLAAPLEVNLHITPTHYGVTEPDIAALIKEYAEDAFDITIFQEEYGAYKDSYKTTATQEINLWAWSANFPSSVDWATQFVGSSGWGPGFSDVLGGDMAHLYPYIDNLIVEAAGTTNQTRKLEILEELQDLWAEWVPNIFAWREVKYQFTRENVEGAVYGALMWDVHFENAVIS